MNANFPGRITVIASDDVPRPLVARYDIEGCRTADQFGRIAGELYPALVADHDFPLGLLVFIMTSRAMVGVGPAETHIGMIVPHSYTRTREAAGTRSGRQRIASEAARQWDRLKRADYDVGSAQRPRLHRFLTGIAIAVEQELEGAFVPDVRRLMALDLVVPDGVAVFDFAVTPADPFGRFEPGAPHLFGSREMERMLNPFESSRSEGCCRDCPAIVATTTD